MRAVLVGLTAAAALASTGFSAGAGAPVVSFTDLPRGWHATQLWPEAYALSWRHQERNGGWAASMPKNGIAVSVFFPRQAAQYPPLKRVMPKRPATTLEGAKDTPQYRIHGRVSGRNVAVWISIRRPKPTTAQLRTAQRVLTGLRFTPAPATTPVGCPPTMTRTLISTFITAFNAGDQRTLDATWAARDMFKWYSVATEPGAGTQGSARRELLLPYFATRHAANERLKLTSMLINSDSAGGYRNFEFKLTRSADDLPGGPIAYAGKGAATCSTGQLMVWSMGPSP